MDGVQALEQFQRALNEPTVQAAVLRLRERSGGYAQLSHLASRTGTRAGKILTGAMSDQAVDGLISYDAALDVLRPVMEANYELIADLSESVQKRINTEAGVGLNPIRPRFNLDRVQGIAKEFSEIEDIALLLQQLAAQVENASLSTVDDAVRSNADFQYSVGRRPRIIRTGGAGCCTWCADLVGTYDYESVRGSDVFSRHANCRCVVEFDPGDGSRQNVHTKEWS